MSATELRSIADQAHEAAALFRLTDRLYRATSDHDIYEAALDAITGTMGCSRASILLFDDAGVMRFVASRNLSASYRDKVTGHSPWKPGHRDPHPIFVSDIDDTGEADWVKSAVRAEKIRSLAFIPLVAQGVVIGKLMMYYEAPHAFTPFEMDLAVTIARQLGFAIDRSRVEHTRRDNEDHFRMMCEHAPVMIWMSDAHGKCLHLNRLLRDFWSIEESPVVTFDWGKTIHPDDAAMVGEIMTGAISRRCNVNLKARYRRADGAYRVLHTDARPRMRGAEFVGLIGVNVDITEQEEQERARRDAEDRRELLVGELNHRVKNTLSVVQAIANQTFKDVDPALRQAFHGRLVALARSHAVLTRAEWTSVALREVAGAATQDAEEKRVTLSGPDVMLTSVQAVSISMVLHELFTNALKYGALSNAEGHIELRWSVEPDTLTMLWREQGGPPVAPPTRSGFGSVLLERMVKGDLRGRIDLDYRPEGVVCELQTQLSPVRPAGA